MDKQCIYVQLDALLDTRLAVISKLNPEAAVKLLTEDAYYLRQIDDFEELTGITRSAFQEAYAKRDVEILQNSRITHIPMMLYELISKMEQMETDTPFVEDLQVHVNYWPYVLSDDERYQFELAISAYSGIETPVRLFSQHPMELTPRHIKQTYSGLILYDFREWCSYHITALENVHFPTITVIAPALFHDKVLKPEEYLTDEMRPDITAFQLTELAFLEKMQLQLLAPQLFSILRF